jgi:hypothetical protein
MLGVFIYNLLTCFHENVLDILPTLGAINSKLSGVQTGYNEETWLL